MKKPAFLSVVAYAAEVMTMPVGTRFELHGQKVGRVTYTARTCKLLMNAMYPGRWTIQRRWHTGRFYQRFDGARWHFFGYNPVGVKILDIVDDLHKKHPESSVIHKLWLFCLPF